MALAHDDLLSAAAAAGLAVRGDLLDCHRALLEHLRRPGSWLTGAERIAIAAESRHAPSCRLCRERKASLSPEQPPGEHTRAPGSADLSAPLLDVVHRVRNDSGRLSRAWFERVLASGLAVGPYVEAVGIVALLAGIDAFWRALGAPAPALPAPLAGEPSGYTPRGLRSDVAWVPILVPEDAGGPETDLYGRDGTVVPNIARALSSVPDHVRALRGLQLTHYLSLAEMGDPKAGRAIDRMQIELVAARVSALNECFY